MAILEATSKQETEGKELQPLEEGRGPAPSRTKTLRREREVSTRRTGGGGKGVELLHRAPLDCTELQPHRGRVWLYECGKGRGGEPVAKRLSWDHVSMGDVATVVKGEKRSCPFLCTAVATLNGL